MARLLVSKPVHDMQVELVPRQVFVNEGWFDYDAGQHVTFIGPTQCGKTTLAMQLLRPITTDDESHAIQAIILVMKPRDKVPVSLMKKMNYKRVSTWPPANASKWHPVTPPGWVVWPKLGNIDTDDAKLRRTFESVFRDSYARAARAKANGRIIFADEIVGITKELKLESNCKAVWMRGSSMQLGLWSASQRPFEVPLLAYNSATHIFLHRDPDKRNRDRYQEIGGVDMDRVKAILNVLQHRQFLYIRRTDEAMCIVDA